MTPSHAKMLLFALKDNLEKYERVFGEVKIHQVVNQSNINIPKGQGNWEA